MAPGICPRVRIGAEALDQTENLMRSVGSSTGTCWMRLWVQDNGIGIDRRVFLGPNLPDVSTSRPALIQARALDFPSCGRQPSVWAGKVGFSESGPGQGEPLLD